MNMGRLQETMPYWELQNAKETYSYLQVRTIDLRLNLSEALYYTEHVLRRISTWKSSQWGVNRSEGGGIIGKRQWAPDMMLYGDKKAVGEKEVVIKIEWAGGSTKGNGSWRNIAGGSERNIAGGSENNNRGVCCALEQTVLCMHLDPGATSENRRGVLLQCPGVCRTARIFEFPSEAGAIDLFEI